jgi:type IV secretory pathway VirB2 component (pilin)
LAIAFAHLAVFGHFVRLRLGWPAALLGLLLFAVSSSDIYQADYLRGYGLAKLAVLVSFIGLVDALERAGTRRGWLVYAGGAVVAIFCHTTMVLWPVIATLAVIADAGLCRDWNWRPIVRLLAADVATAVLSGWVLVMAFAQLRSLAAANITWLEPLGWADFRTTCKLQLLTGGAVSAGLMAAAMAIGAWRGRHVRAVRLAIGVVIGAVVLFKATDMVHPIVSDFTLHWGYNFSVLIAAASLVGGGEARPLHRAGVVLVLAGMALAGLVDLLLIEPDWQPQDWRRTVQTVAARPDAALLASHESIGVVIEQTCVVEFGKLPCPFPLVVMADPKPTDNWSFGGYHGALVAPSDVRAALGRAREVFAFSRYYYTPLQHLGLHPADWHEVFWDDGELIGPIPIHAFDPPGPGEAPRVADPDAQYTGAPDPE